MAIIKKTCLYRTANYNLLPAVLVTPQHDGFIVALKLWNWHAGVYIAKGEDHEFCRNHREQL